MGLEVAVLRKRGWFTLRMLTSCTPTADSDESVPPPLPEGWSEHFDAASQQYYYYNSNDGSTTWERPAPPPESPSTEVPELTGEVVGGTTTTPTSELENSNTIDMRTRAIAAGNSTFFSVASRARETLEVISLFCISLIKMPADKLCQQTFDLKQPLFQLSDR